MKSFFSKNGFSSLSSRRRLPFLTVSAFAALTSLTWFNARSADVLWDVASGDFQTDSNWAGGSAPVAGDIAIISNSGTATLDGDAIGLGQIWVGNDATGTLTGTMNQVGGNIILTDGLVIGRRVNTVGTYNLTGGTLTTPNLRVGAGAFSASGTLTVSGADTVLITTQNGVAGVVGIGTPGTGVMTLADSATWSHIGTTVVDVGGDNNSINQNGGNGTLNIQSGATVELITADMAVGRNPGAVGTVTIDGGSLILSGLAAAINLGTVHANVGRNGGTGTLTLNSGAVTASRINIATGANINPGSGVGVVNFNGGTATIGGITKGSGSGTVHFNGTTIQASEDNLDFYGGFAAVDLDIQAGGQKFDTNGHAVTITQGLTGIGGLTKQGAGTLTLAGASAFTGATRIEGGVLQLGVSEAIANASNLTLATGTLNLGGFSETVGTLNVEGDAFVDFGALAGANSLTFADSSLADWSGSLALLNFDVATDTLSFSSTNGLTESQLQSIVLQGYEVTGLDANGVVQFSAVPEPGTIALLALGGLIFLGRRRGLA